LLGYDFSAPRFLFLFLVLCPRRMRGKRSHENEHPTSQQPPQLHQPGGFFVPGFSFQLAPSIFTTHEADI
jgi:hypothetical protein